MKPHRLLWYVTSAIMGCFGKRWSIRKKRNQDVGTNSSSRHGCDDRFGTRTRWGPLSRRGGRRRLRNVRHTWDYGWDASMTSLFPKQASIYSRNSLAPDVLKIPRRFFYTGDIHRTLRYGGRQSLHQPSWRSSVVFVGGAGVANRVAKMALETAIRWARIVVTALLFLFQMKAQSSEYSQ